MSGGLMQLVAYGAQDIYLTGNPQITFFKIVYRRHTNFAIETVEQTFIGNVDFGKRISSKITRNGDLVTKMYLRITLNSVNPNGSSFAWTRRIGHAIVNTVEIEIGGTTMDRQYGTWLDIWYELARQGDHDLGYANMIGDIPSLTTYDNSIKPQYVLYVPLQFWFNRFVGLAIPLIALQYQDTYVHFTISPVLNLVISDCKFDVASNVSLGDITILVNYVYLDTDERRRFALVGHEYLMEQVQFTGLEPVTTDAMTYTVNFNFPVKELIWAMRNGNYIINQAFIYYDGSGVWDVSVAACLIVQNSISINFNPQSTVGGTWYELLAGQIATIGTFNVNNKNALPIYVNPTSLSIGTYGITSQINVDVTVNADNSISCNYITTTLTIRDLSIPVSLMTDTRYNTCDPQVYIFSNYGILIDGTNNPVATGLIQFNGQDRFDVREGAYFNYVQPEQCHNNTPADGINVYSFAIHPEEHQPSGTANFSRIDTSTLILTFADSTQTGNLPSLNLFNTNNQLYIFGTNYNVLRCYAGLAGLAYTG